MIRRTLVACRCDDLLVLESGLHTAAGHAQSVPIAPPPSQPATERHHPCIRDPTQPVKEKSARPTSR